jgi:hypothetical protein
MEATIATDTGYDSTEDTARHIMEVQERLWAVINMLTDRGLVHDASKLDVEGEEKAMFDRFTPKLGDTEYGSAEYKQLLAEMGPGLASHYRKNRHHPEHFEGIGILGMTLIDIVEMFCDWAAATFRMKNGDVGSSIDKNAERFHIGEQLVQIFHNTAFALGWEEEE